MIRLLLRTAVFLGSAAIGLLVALPAVAVYNYFNRKIKTLNTGAEALVHVLLAHMDGK